MSIFLYNFNIKIISNIYIIIMSNLSFIGVSERAYKYIRQFTIKSVDDAITELITNAIDAYNKTSYTDRLIEIDIMSKSELIIRDRAIGLTAEELSSCFLQVGTYTADSDSRGFFSRGAKDISSLGDIYFNTVKNNKYSECVLNTDAYGAVTVENIDITTEIRNKLGIPDPYNGLEVVIKLLPNFANISAINIYNSISKLGVLRDIVMDSSNRIVVRQIENNNIVYENRVKYSFPDSEILLDITYNVPNYTDKKARFVVKKSNTPLPQPTKESLMEFGFLIKDSTTVYEVNTIAEKYRWNPYINYIHGYLSCDGIKEYLMDYDTNGPTEMNPYPIIDPSRLTGVNKEHPFITNLLSIPLVRLDLILRELNSQISNKMVTIEDIDELLNELSEYGINIIESENIEVKFNSTYDTNLIKAVENDREKYVTVENSYSISGNYSTKETYTNNYIKDQITDIEQGIYPGYHYILGPENEVIQIPDSNTIQDDVGLILELIPNDNMELVEVHPYIYKLNDSGELKKLYIFSRGTFDNNINENDNTLLIKNKQFVIEFINDLNLQHRYIIDNTNGITIKLNLNNPIIKKYMVNKTIENLPDNINLSTVSSSKTLIFFEELITDILATIILESDVENRKLILDSTSINNVKKVDEYYNSIVTKIEVPINNIIDKHIANVLAKKIDITNNKINKTYDQISLLSQGNPNLSEIETTISTIKTEVELIME